jgi:hypothetical protein
VKFSLVWKVPNSQSLESILTIRGQVNVDCRYPPFTNLAFDSPRDLSVGFGKLSKPGVLDLILVVDQGVKCES